MDLSNSSSLEYDLNLIRDESFEENFSHAQPQDEFDLAVALDASKDALGTLGTVKSILDDDELKQAILNTIFSSAHRQLH